MKKIYLLLMIGITFVLVGCSKDGEDSVVKNMKNKIKDVDSYYLSGDLKIYNDKEEYNYDVEVYYKKEDFYRVNLVNNFNSHEQIILKNNDGVYVVTPSLNKSFKFQSNWPNDSSQIYLIESLYKDIISNNERKFQSNDKEYVFEVNANYPNNSNLVKQSIILDKEYNIKNVKVFNGDSEIQMCMTFNEMTLNKEIEDSVFDLNNIITNMNDENNSEDSVGSINDIIYPLYIPSGTVLTSEEKVSKGEGERIILTFDGEKPFILVEETVDKTDEFLIVPTYGEPYLMMDTVATLSNNSISWINDGIEYYIVSDVMSQIELVEIASSITKIEYNK